MVWRRFAFLLVAAFATACAKDPSYYVQPEPLPDGIPVDLSGSWERDYSLGGDMNSQLQTAYRNLTGTQDLRNPNGGYGASAADIDKLVALARFADEITRQDTLTILQNDYEISIERKDDYAMLCAFYDGLDKPTVNDYGMETCGWDGEQLVSSLVLPDGLIVSHRFVVSDDRMQLRVSTTISSSASRTPFTLHRFYRKFDRPESELNCVETLSMKRVCSTGELEP